MIFKMLKNSFVVLIVFLLLSFVYIISSQKSKISAYEYGGDNNVINDALVIENNIGMDKKIGDSNIDSFISCYEEPIEKEDFTDEMNKKLNEINKHFASSPTKVSFTYEDLFTGLHLSYNENSTNQGGLQPKDIAGYEYHHSGSSSDADYNFYYNRKTYDVAFHLHWAV